MSEIDDIAQSCLDAYLKEDPLLATYLGESEGADRMPDFSEVGARRHRDIAQETLSRLSGADTTERRDVIGARSMEIRLGLNIEVFEAGEWMRDLNILSSPPQGVRMAFDLAPRGSEEEWSNIASRLHAVADSLSSYRSALEQGRSERLVAAVRQTEEVAKQCEGLASTSGADYFGTLASSYSGGDVHLERHLTTGAEAARSSYGELGRYLKDVYLPNAAAKDAVGPERWSLMCREHNGEAFEAKETYAWGWEELERIEEAMRVEAAKILPGESLKAVFDHLDHDEGRSIVGAENFLRWNQELLDETIARVDGVHFDIPEPIKTVEAMIAPEGGAAAMYYTGPSLDLQRPGRTWYPVNGKTNFPLWSEYTTAYHEGVPGHHLQIGYVTWMGERLNAFQRVLGGVNGHIEGWALYAERLMDELGYYDDPAYRLGMLSAQAFRAARIVVDIGLHHEYRIPAHRSLFPDEVWQQTNAVEFMIATAGVERPFAISEVDRYLGYPAQATSYKLGERVWLETRESAKKREGSSFTLKSFHQRGFELGFVGLAQLREELG